MIEGHFLLYEVIDMQFSVDKNHLKFFKQFLVNPYRAFVGIKNYQFSILCSQILFFIEILLYQLEKVSP
jgi:hypothetical protein